MTDGIAENGARIQAVALYDWKTGQALGASTGVQLPDSYLGQVATRCSHASDFANNNNQVMSRTIHVARDDISALSVEVANFYFNGSAETPTGADATVELAVEYPLGVTITRLPFDGANQGTIPNGQAARSDLTPVTIPRGASFAIRKFWNCSAGILYNRFQYISGFGDGLTIGVTTPNRVTDLTFAGNDGAGFGATSPPTAIVAYTRRPSVLILGDSRAAGFTTNTSFETGNGGGDKGEVARSIGPRLAYISQALGGHRLTDYINSHTQRVLQAQYVTDVIVQLMTNDSGDPAATIEAHTSQVGALFPGKRVWLTTAPAQVGGDYTSTAGMTVSPNYSTAYFPANNWRRGVPAPFVGCFDVAAVVEDPVNAGKLLPSRTLDGTHETELAYLEIEKSGVVNPYAIELAALTSQY